MNAQVINMFQYEPSAHTGESYKDVLSLTVPDQSLTVREIVTRFVNGQPVTGSHSVYYDNVDDFDVIDPTLDPSFDLADATAIANQLAESSARRLAKAKAHKEGTQRSGVDDAEASAEAIAKPEDSAISGAESA